MEVYQFWQLRQVLTATSIYDIRLLVLLSLLITLIRPFFLISHIIKWGGLCYWSTAILTGEAFSKVLVLFVLFFSRVSILLIIAIFLFKLSIQFKLNNNAVSFPLTPSLNAVFFFSSIVYGFNYYTSLMLWNIVSCFTTISVQSSSFSSYYLLKFSYITSFIFGSNSSYICCLIAAFHSS